MYDVTKCSKKGRGFKRSHSECMTSQGVLNGFTIKTMPFLIYDVTHFFKMASFEATPLFKTICDVIHLKYRPIKWRSYFINNLWRQKFKMASFEATPLFKTICDVIHLKYRPIKWRSYFINNMWRQKFKMASFEATPLFKTICDVKHIKWRPLKWQSHFRTICEVINSIWLFLEPRPFFKQSLTSYI
jgi:hypothetical protein